MEQLCSMRNYKFNMFVDYNYRFEVSVSSEAYFDKEYVSAAIGSDGSRRKELGIKEKMSFKRTSLTVKDLLEKSINGYSFCNLFSGFPENGFGKTYTWKNGNFSLSAKSNEFFEGSYLFAVDVDDTKFTSPEEYIVNLPLKPSFWYTSFSNQKPGKGLRFRLVYVLDQKIEDLQEYSYLTKSFTGWIEKYTGETLEDKCSEKASQYFNGTNINNPDLKIEYGSTKLIYSISDFGLSLSGFVPEVPEEKEERSEKVEVKFTKWLVKDMKEKSYNEFMSSHSLHYKYFWKTEVDFTDKPYMKTPENYIELFWNQGKLEDGEKRRMKLDSRAAQRRLMNPDITPDELLFNLYIDREKFFDNSDGVLSIEQLQKNVENAFQLSQTELKEKFQDYIGLKKFIIDPEITNKQYTINKAKKEFNWSEIDKSYDPKLSVKDNLEKFEHLGLKVKKSTLYNYCKEKGISPKGEVSDVIGKYYDPNLSIRENLKVLKDNNVKCSYSTLQRYINSNKEDNMNNSIEETTTLYVRNGKNESPKNDVLEKMNHPVFEVPDFFNSPEIPDIKDENVSLDDTGSLDFGFTVPDFNIKF